MNKKLQDMLDELMRDAGFDIPENIVSEYRGREIVVIKDDGKEEVLRKTAVVDSNKDKN